ncbi:MAG: PEP-CTERM sorting domain-containing protein [Verrucomicrobiota bacterium]
MLARAFFAFIIVGFCQYPLRAEIITRGNVPDGDPSTWISRPLITIGSDEYGSLVVNGGSVLDSPQARIGVSFNSSKPAWGEVTVTGPGSTWNLSVQDFSFQDMLIGWGVAARGKLTVSNGGLVTTTSDVELHGSLTNDSPAVVRVTGQNSRLEIDGWLTVSPGPVGNARLIVSDGGYVVSERAFLRPYAGEGHTLVTGQGSVLESKADLSIGPSEPASLFLGSGNASLTLGAGATVKTGSRFTLGEDSPMYLQVSGDNMVQVGGEFTILGNLHLYAHGLATGPLKPISAAEGVNVIQAGEVIWESPSGNPSNDIVAKGGSIITHGGTWDAASETFTPYSIIDGGEGLENQDVSNQRYSFAFDDSVQVVAGFSSDAGQIDFSVNDLSLSTLNQLKVLGAYQFLTDLDDNEMTILSFFIGDGYKDSQLAFWHQEGVGEWSLHHPDIYSYYDGWVSFSVTEFSNYAVTVPEPGTVGLLLVGTLCFLARRRRFRD